MKAGMWGFVFLLVASGAAALELWTLDKTARIVVALGILGALALRAVFRTREFAADPALLVVRARAALREHGVCVHPCRPAFDTAAGLEAGHGGDEVAAGQVVRGGERLAIGRVRMLLGHRRQSERAPDDDALERARLTAELPRDDVGVSVHAAAS